MAAIGASRPLPRAPSEGPLTQPTAHSTVAEGTALPSPNLLSRHTQHRCEPTRVSPCRTGGSSAQRPPTDLIQNLRSIHQWFDVDDLCITRAKPAQFMAYRFGIAFLVEELLS